MKKVIRLTESDLHRIIENSVKKILSETPQLWSKERGVPNFEPSTNLKNNPEYLYRLGRLGANHDRQNPSYPNPNPYDQKAEYALNGNKFKKEDPIYDKNNNYVGSSSINYNRSTPQYDAYSEGDRFSHLPLSHEINQETLNKARSYNNFQKRNK